MPYGKEGIQLEHLPTTWHPRSFVGLVERPDEKTAIQTAIEFKITDKEQQKRLVAQRRR
jgi:hypothetical protein